METLAGAIRVSPTRPGVGFRRADAGLVRARDLSGDDCSVGDGSEDRTRLLWQTRGPKPFPSLRKR